MDLFFQAAGAVLLTVIAALTLDGHAKTSASMLVMSVCVMVLAGCLEYLSPVLDFLHSLSGMTGLEEDILTVLFKVLGICVVSEIAVLICQDAGHTSLGKSLQILANGTILWLSLPLFRALMELMQGLMEAL